MAEGLEKTATPEKARILRPVPGADSREEVPVDLKVMLAGGASDVALQDWRHPLHSRQDETKHLPIPFGCYFDGHEHCHHCPLLTQQL